MQLAPPTQTPLSQTSSPGQVPQSIIPKQPLPMTPQYCPLGGVQVTDGVQTPVSGIERSGVCCRASVIAGASGPPVGVSAAPPSAPGGVSVGDMVRAQAPAPNAIKKTIRTRGLLR